MCIYIYTHSSTCIYIYIIYIYIYTNTMLWVLLFFCLRTGSGRFTPVAWTWVCIAVLISHSTKPVDPSCWPSFHCSPGSPSAVAVVPVSAFERLPLWSHARDSSPKARLWFLGCSVLLRKRTFPESPSADPPRVGPRLATNYVMLYYVILNMILCYYADIY